MIARTPDGAVDPVCEFYTRYPYPPPLDNLDRAREEWRDGTRERAEYHLLWPERAYRRDLDILVAGCGTWQAAKEGEADCWFGFREKGEDRRCFGVFPSRADGERAVELMRQHEQDFERSLDQAASRGRAQTKDRGIDR